MARLESGEKAEEKKTIESMRKFDETTVEPDDAGEKASVYFLIWRSNENDNFLND